MLSAAHRQQMPFQSTLPRGERRHPRQFLNRVKKFQSTLPRGERLYLLPAALQAQRFQSTLPRGERQDGKGYFRPAEDISIHAPARGATAGGKRRIPPTWNFNPRSREGSDHTLLILRLQRFSISIHAPARGATLLLVGFVRMTVISIHAPARGATPGFRQNNSVCPISIHAPARGATLLCHARLKLIEISIHAPARGATSQSGVTFGSGINFNPRSREGSDWFEELDIFKGPISIHAPARGATRKILVKLQLPQISIHAPARGATICRGVNSMTTTFQSTLPRGERLHLLTFFRLQYGYILFHLTNKYSFCF